MNWKDLLNYVVSYTKIDTNSKIEITETDRSATGLWKKSDKAISIDINLYQLDGN